MHTRLLRFLILAMLFSAITATAPSGALLKARYRQVEGTDPSYGQGAIEKNDLAHREIEPMIWLILVDEPGDPATWQNRLAEVTSSKNGSWSVERASPEEVEAVRTGKIALQK
jgi:hypothetical protein